jgi:fatty-acyl-CoA synthase
VKLRADASVTEAEIQAYCRGKIAHQKVPRYIRFVEAFPMTVTGKMQKFLMRRAMQEELGLHDANTA